MNKPVDTTTPPQAASSGASRGAAVRARRSPVPIWALLSLPPAFALGLLCAGWELWTRMADVPVYMVPAPSVVFARLFGDLPFFVTHGAITLGEALAGFALGTAVALAGATLMAHSRLIERSLYPIAILVKVTPVVAVAPLFVIWFGFGPAPKVLVAALITFFPVLVNGVTGFRSVDPGALDFLRSLRTSRRRVFFILRVPSAMPYLFAAFRVAIPLSVIGAVVGEWFSASKGLGSVIFIAHSNLDMPTLFAAVIVLSAMGVALTAIASLIERKILFWHESSLI